MTDETISSENWQIRAELAEAALNRVQTEANEKLIQVELRAEALRAGMIDLDGLKLLKAEEIKLNEAGELSDASAVLAKLKRAKPWLFGSATSSSSAAHAPRPEQPRVRHATELSRDEWLAARTALIRRR